VLNHNREQGNKKDVKINEEREKEIEIFPVPTKRRD